MNTPMLDLDGALLEVDVAPTERTGFTRTQPHAGHHEPERLVLGVGAEQLEQGVDDLRVAEVPLLWLGSLANLGHGDWIPCDDAITPERLGEEHEQGPSHPGDAGAALL